MTSPADRHPWRHALGATFVRLAGAGLSLLMPLRCAVCGREGAYLCDGCEPALPRLREPYCARCADPSAAPLCRWCVGAPPAFDRITAPYLMEGAVRTMVHDLKYRGLRAAAPAQGRWLAAHLASMSLPADAVVPVPLHPRRERRRGYNQSELLAREVSRRAGVPLRSDVLRRTRNTAPQVSLASDDHRRTNTVGAFACVAPVEGLRVLLVDDVVTTGSTMSAAAVALKVAGARAVWGLALARQA